MALRAVAASKKRIQIAVLCGQSDRLYKRVSKLAENYEFPVKVFPQIEARAMSTLIHLSDWVFGRPGAGLTSEVVAKNTHMIFDVRGGIMPQEHNNLNFFKNQGLLPRVAKNDEMLSSHIVSDFTMLPPKIELQPEIIKKTIANVVGHVDGRN